MDWVNNSWGYAELKNQNREVARLLGWSHFQEAPMGETGINPNGVFDAPVPFYLFDSAACLRDVTAFLEDLLGPAFQYQVTLEHDSQEKVWTASYTAICAEAENEPFFVTVTAETPSLALCKLVKEVAKALELDTD